MKVLVAEDDSNTRDGLIEILQMEGYDTVAAASGKEALAAFTKEAPDFVCLDIMMPDINGYDVCREIRRFNEQTPIIFISAKSEEIDKVLGLEIGADDYIVKPFGVKEVIARMHAVMRRIRKAAPPEKQASTFQMADLEIVPAELRAYRGQTAIDLGPRDLKILTLLHEKAGQVVTRDELFDRCWGMNYLPDSRSLDQHVSQLRKKIEKDPKQPQLIRTVHGAGYRYE